MDDDGFEDSEDNCWNMSNTDQLDTDGDSISSIGMVGTVVAISAGFFLAIRREDEE